MTQAQALALLRGFSPPWDTDVLARTVADAIAPSGGSTTFAQQAEAASIVVDTTITASAGNVYKTAAEAAVERKKLNGPCIVEFRQSQAVPVAAYDWRDASGAWNTTMRSSQGQFTLTCANGVTFVGVASRENLSITYTGAGVLQAAPAGVALFTFTNGLDQCTGGGLILGAGAGAVAIVNQYRAHSTTGAASVYGTTAAGAVLFVQGFEISNLDTNTLAQVAASTVTYTAASAAARFNTTQVAMVGGLLVAGTNLSIASNANNLSNAGNVLPAFQAGTGVALVAGTVDVTAVKLAAGSVIQITRKNSSGSAINSELQAPLASRDVAGNKFTVQAWDALAGGVDATDTSTFDWLVINL